MSRRTSSAMTRWATQSKVTPSSSAIVVTGTPLR